MVRPRSTSTCCEREMRPTTSRSTFRLEGLWLPRGIPQVEVIAQHRCQRHRERPRERSRYGRAKNTITASTNLSKMKLTDCARRRRMAADDKAKREAESATTHLAGSTDRESAKEVGEAEYRKATPAALTELRAKATTEPRPRSKPRPRRPSRLYNRPKRSIDHGRTGRCGRGQRSFD